ncbi:hypothetical protein GQ600_8073 [Phytophthora cactorum]|nr:hypothetical protein GQ600_8073 [Phytophthora cactorum]
MTPRYVWKTVRSDMAREDSQLLMEDMKVFIIVKSPLVPRSRKRRKVERAYIEAEAEEDYQDQ